MKKLLLWAAFVAFAGAASAADTVLSISAIHVGGRAIQLLKTETAEGLVCQEYVAQMAQESAKQGEGSLTVKISRICDEPVRVAAPAGSLAVEEVFPKKLKAMRWVGAADGIGVHALDLEVEATSQVKAAPSERFAALVGEKSKFLLSGAGMRGVLPQLLDRAVNDPSDANVAAYLYAQRVMVDKAADASLACAGLAEPEAKACVDRQLASAKFDEACPLDGTISSQSDGRLLVCADGKWSYTGAVFEGALFATQVLATSVCREKANLDPVTLSRESSALMFFSALRSLLSVGILPATVSPEVLAERMAHLTCGQGGILQLDLPAS